MNKMHKYGVGYIGQGSSYSFMSTYLVLYLTNCVGMSPSRAGLISSLALLLEVAGGMLIGNLSDKCTSKFGRRLPFMFTAGVVMIPIFVLLFHGIGGSEALQFAYCLIFSMLFRVFFSTFEIPNQAFGANIASGYDERTRLRTVSRYYSIIGNAIGYILPLLVLQMYLGDEKTGWQMVGVGIGVTTAIPMILTVFLNRDKDPGFIPQEVSETSQKKKDGSVLRSYLELLKLKPSRMLVAYKTAFSCAYALYNVANIYYLQFSVGLDNRYTSYIYYIVIVIFFTATPLIDRMAIRVGKVGQQLQTMIVCGAVSIAVFVFCPNRMVGAVVYMIAFSVVQSGFWQLSSAIFYDVIEVDEWANGKRREGDLMSMVSVLGTFISAIVVEIFGIFLEMSGFDAEALVQTQKVAGFLNVSFILLPGVFLLAGGLVLKRFPINKDTFASLKAALEARRNGEDYSQYLDDVNYILTAKKK